MTEREALPEPWARISSVMGKVMLFDAPDFSMRKGDSVYTADQMQAYGAACAKEARAAALLEAVEACDDVEEKPWYGYENPNTFSDGKAACMRAIRAMGGGKEGAKAKVLSDDQQLYIDSGGLLGTMDAPGKEAA